MMAAGSDEAFARCREAVEACAAKCFRVGSRPGDGSRMKIVNNMAAAANLAAGAEAMALASKLGLDLAQVAEVVQASSGASWMFGEHMPRALAHDYAPRAAARVLVKDVGLFVDAARAGGIEPAMALAALEAFRDTAERGYAEAQYDLGVLYAAGRGAPQDLTQAAAWYRKAADQGHDSAALNLGALYFSGRGVPQDAAEAVRWFRVAAQQGNGHAQFNLAALYAQGQGAPQNLPAALVWFSAASATLKGEEAKAALDDGKAVAGQMTPAQKDAAKTIAQACKAGEYSVCQ